MWFPFCLLIFTIHKKKILNLFFVKFFHKFFQKTSWVCEIQKKFRGEFWKIKDFEGDKKKRFNPYPVRSFIKVGDLFLPAIYHLKNLWGIKVFSKGRFFGGECVYEGKIYLYCMKMLIFTTHKNFFWGFLPWTSRISQNFFKILEPFVNF